MLPFVSFSLSLIRMTGQSTKPLAWGPSEWWVLVLSLKGLGAEPRVCTLRMCNEMICENLIEILKNKRVNFLRHWYLSVNCFSCCYVVLIFFKESKTKSSLFQ